MKPPKPPKPQKSTQIDAPRIVTILGFCVALLITAFLIRMFLPGEPGTPQKNDVVTSKNPSTEPAAILSISSGAKSSDPDDPVNDGWQTEFSTQIAQKALNQLGTELFGADASMNQLLALCDDNFTSDPIVPQPLTPKFSDDVLEIRTWSRGDSPKAARDAQTLGRAAFLEASRAIQAFWSAAEGVEFEFKIVRINVTAGQLETRQYVAVSGRSEDTMVEQHATWNTRWSIDPRTKHIRLVNLQVEEFEETINKTAQPLFTDCTESLVGFNPQFKPQFLRGLNHWLNQTQDLRYSSPMGNPGLAIGDVNGDGLDDLYVCQEANLPNRLFIQQPDGSARDESETWQVNWLDGSRSALLVDLDNDGDQDLAVAILGGLVTAENTGQRFVVRDVLPTHDDTSSISAADYDLDGDLDLYVCVDYPNDYFSSRNLQPERTIPADQPRTGVTNEAQASKRSVQVGAANRVYHDSNEAGENTLFRNEFAEGNPWGWKNVTADVGLDVNNQRFTWAASWEDFDNDGDQDLYVANDFGRNNLFRNDNGSFVDVAASLGVEDMASGMSTAWGDINQDGNVDLYVGNMFSSAGNRITRQPNFKPNSTDEVRSHLQRFARGNSLFQNQGAEGFTDISLKAGVNLGRWAWSSNFIDINNDGWLDIAVANGYITHEDTRDL